MESLSRNPSHFYIQISRNAFIHQNCRCSFIHRKIPEISSFVKTFDSLIHQRQKKCHYFPKTLETSILIRRITFSFIDQERTWKKGEQKPVLLLEKEKVPTFMLPDGSISTVCQRTWASVAETRYIIHVSAEVLSLCSVIDKEESTQKRHEENNKHI